MICIWPFLFVSPGESLPLRPEVMNHELIHARQQREMLFLFFYIWYGLEFLVRWIQHHDRYAAYRALAHEKEAYCKENDMAYLKGRRHFAWTKYLSKGSRKDGIGRY